MKALRVAIVDDHPMFRMGLAAAIGERFELDHFLIHTIGEVAAFVENVGDAAAHAGREVATCATEDDRDSAGHVLTTVIAHPFDDGLRAAIADAESFAGHAAKIQLSGGRAVQTHVAGDDVLLGDERRLARRIDDHLAA